MLITYDSLGITQDNLSRWIFQKLDTFFENGSTEYDIEFDFADKTFSHEINFVELFSTESKGYEWAHSTSNYFSSIAGVLIGIKVENDETDARSTYRLSFIFDKAVFDSYPNFDNLRCHKLSFSNTVFKKGARFRHIDVDEVLFEPRELSADATFFHREKADIENGILRGDYKGRIGKFQYRHQLEGDGTTFLIGMKFTEQAKFTDCVLDKVQFSFIDEDSMSKCFFANSMIEDAKFYNCKFQFKPNAKKFALFSWLPSPIAIISIAIITAFALLFLSYGMGNSMVKNIVFIVGILLTVMVLFMFNRFLFMPLMSLFAWCIGRVFEINCHIAVGDDTVVDKVKNINDKRRNYESVREVYRQLKINFEKHGDYQTAGEFYYSQRYYEMINWNLSVTSKDGQSLLFGIHHWVNGFGERWLRAAVWFLLTIWGFAFLYTPNEDFISTKSTPEYFLNAFDVSSTRTSKVAFNTERNTSDFGKLASSHFMEIATTNYKDSSVEYIKDKNASIIAKQIKDINKTFYAFDNRFDFYYTSQFIPVLKTEDNFDLKLTHSLSKMIAPFISEEKKWFQDRTEKAYYLGFLESILLWIFFLAFVFAVKNRIRR